MTAALLCHRGLWPTNKSLLALALPKASNKIRTTVHCPSPPKTLPDLQSVSGERRQSVTTGLHYHIKIYLEGESVNCALVVNDGRGPRRGLGAFFYLFPFPKFIDFQSQSRFCYLSGKGLPVVYTGILCLTRVSPFSIVVIRTFHIYFSFYMTEDILCIKNIYTNLGFV